MTKKYQNNKIDTPTGDDGVVVPERVSVAMAEIVGPGRERLAHRLAHMQRRLAGRCWEARNISIAPDGYCLRPR